MTEERREDLKQRRRLGQDIVIPFGALIIFAVFIILTFLFVFSIFHWQVNLQNPVVSGLVGAMSAQMFNVIIIMAGAYYRDRTGPDH